MNRSTSDRATHRCWRVFSQRDGRRIEFQIRTVTCPCCPFCGGILEARPNTRLGMHIPLDASGYDLDCRTCRRFWCVVRHTPRSRRLRAMRRLVAAIRAIPPRAAGPSLRAESATPAAV